MASEKYQNLCEIAATAPHFYFLLILTRRNHDVTKTTRAYRSKLTSYLASALAYAGSVVNLYRQICGCGWFVLVAVAFALYSLEYYKKILACHVLRLATYYVSFTRS